MTHSLNIWQCYLSIKDTFLSPWASLVAQLVKNPPAVWETWVQPQGWKYALEKGKATHSSILTWRIPWTIQSMGSQRVGHVWAMHFHFSLSCIGEGNGNPLQCSCLENPRDRRAWWAAVYGVAQSRTRLKWLSSSSSNIKSGEGNGNPLQCSCLENPRDEGAWWAAIYGVT